MLQNKKIIFKYKSILKLLSFNKTAMNKGIWYLRNLLRFLFYYLLKKSFFCHFIFYYKFLLSFFYLKKKLFFKNINTFLKNNLLNKGVIFLKKYYCVFLTSQKYIGHISLFNKSLFYSNTFTYWENTISYYNNFYLLYKMYVFFLYIWLYSIKFFYFFSFNWSNLPIKKHTFVLLRSPHKDKKSREKFKIRKLKKNLLIPSFLYHNYFFSSIVNDSFLMKFDLHIKKI